jgi:hypothetical protein
MKKSSEYIAESVFNVNAHYTRLQNETKILFFRCLKENRSKEYFRQEAYKIWGNIDHKFMDKQIDKLQELVWGNNIDLAVNYGRLNGKYVPTQKWVIDDEYFKLVPEAQFNDFERKFEKNVVRNYERSSKTIQNQDKEVYLQKKLKTYDDEINRVVPYFKNGEPTRYVNLSTYLSMLHNTNLTRAGWNETMGDSEKLDIDMFIIPYHPFSCEECFYYQNRPLTKREVEDIIGGSAEERSGDIIHPNCKCTLALYWSKDQISKKKYNVNEILDQYHIRQKVNSLTLEKSRIATDMKIQRELGNEEQYDKLNQRRNAINSKIRDLKEELPTKSLQKQVGAINR